MSGLNGRVRVAVVMGGRSSEHEISLASARSVLEALDPERYDAVTVAIDREGRWELGSGDTRALEGASAAETLPVPTASVPTYGTPASSSSPCTGRSARTAPSRGCSSSREFRTS